MENAAATAVPSSRDTIWVEEAEHHDRTGLLQFIVSSGTFVHGQTPRHLQFQDL